MPKLPCICGYVHNLSPIPDDGWVLVKDTDYEELLEVEARRRALSGAPEGTPNFDALIVSGVCKTDPLASVKLTPFRETGRMGKVDGISGKRGTSERGGSDGRGGGGPANPRAA